MVYPVYGEIPGRLEVEDAGPAHERRLSVFAGADPPSAIVGERGEADESCGKNSERPGRRHACQR